jgi:hypothetical protein
MLYLQNSTLKCQFGKIKPKKPEPKSPEIDPGKIHPERPQPYAPEIHPQKATPEIYPQQPEKEVFPQPSPQIEPGKAPFEFPNTESTLLSTVPAARMPPNMAPVTPRVPTSPPAK